MDLKLTDKVAVVSGSSRGIGKAIAYTLLREGASVYITGRDEKDLSAAYEGFNQQFDGKVFSFCGDLTNTESIKRLMENVVDEHMKLDIVVSNIGSGRSVAGWDVDDEEWTRMFNINFHGTVKLCREAIRVMKETAKGSIVCISSIAGVEAIAAPVPYSSAKAALLSFVKNTSDIAAQYGVRINAVSPGNVLFEGGTWKAKLRENKNRVMEYIDKVVPLKAFASPEDIAEMVAFLASDRAKFVTGANFIIDGGQVRKII